MLKNSSTAKKISELSGSLFRSLPFHPTTYTLLSILLAFVSLVFWVLSFESTVLSLEYRIVGFVLFLFALFIDAIDGALARTKNLVTNQGAFLDGISDRLVEFAIILALFFSFASDFQMQLVLIAILFFGTCMTSFVKAYAEHSQLADHETAKKMPGLFERVERVLLLMLVMFFVALGYSDYARYVLLVVALLSFVTFAQRMWISLKNK